MPDEERMPEDGINLQQALPPVPDLESQREKARQNLLRANTAVALVLLAVFALALLAAVASVRAGRNQRVAEQAEARSRDELWRAYQSEARATRLGSSLGRRSAALENIRRAASIAGSPELRNEAVAVLALTDFSLERSIPVPGGITAIAFDRQLHKYAFGSDKGEIFVKGWADKEHEQLWTSEETQIPQEQGTVQALEFSPDGDTLAARFQYGAFALLDLKTRRLVFRQQHDKVRRSASRPRFTQDGKHILAPIFSPVEGIAVFEAQTGEQRAFFPEFDSVRHAAPRPGHTMFAVNTGTNVVVVDWTSHKRVAEIEFSGALRRLAWTPDGEHLGITGGLEIHIWSFKDGRRRVFTGHKDGVWNIVFDPTGQRLASSSFDGTSRIWDMQSGRLLGITAEGYVSQLGNDGLLGLERIRTAIELRRLGASKVYRSLPGSPIGPNDTRAIDISPDGRWLASVIQSEGIVAWDLGSESMPQIIPFPGIKTLAFDATEPRVLIAHDKGAEWRPLFTETETNGFGMAEESLRLGSRTRIKLPSRFKPFVVTISPSGTLAIENVYRPQVLVVPEKENRNPTLVEEVSQNSMERFAGSPRGAGGLALNPGGSLLAAGYCGNIGANVWDVHAGELLVQISTREGLVQFSPDGQFLALGEAGRYRLFRTNDWQQVWERPRNRALPATAFLGFSPRGEYIAIASSPQAAAILDTQTGDELVRLESPDPAGITGIRWSGDGKRLVFATRENRVDIWSVDALQQELAALGLEFGKVFARAPGNDAGVGGTLFGWAPFVGLTAAGAIGLVLVLALRRHRSLIEDFAKTEALVVQRERDLQVEREVGKLKSSFVSMVSHEFRTPLGVIISSTQLLKNYFDRLSPAKRHDQLGAIEESVHRMKELMEEVLLLGKVESGRMQSKPGPVDLPTLCQKVIADVRTVNGNTCPINCDADLPPALAHLDEGLTMIILSNLLTNALKYSPTGKPVRLTMTRRGPNAVLTVEDHGIGIPAGDQKKLFRSFYRGENVGNIPGTGLGLTIVKRCVDLQGGQIRFSSSETGGTKFTVELPAYRPSDPSASTLSS